MKNRKAIAWAVFFLIVLIFFGLALLFQDFVQQTIVVPLFYLYWITDLLIRSVSQSVYLIITVIIFILLAMWCLANLRSPSQETTETRRYYPESSRYRFWAFQLAKIEDSQFSLDNLGIELRRFLLNLLAYQEGLDPVEVELRIAAGILPVPKEIKELVVKRSLPEIIDQRPRIIWLVEKKFRSRRNISKEERQVSLQEQHIENIIQYIESRLEVNSGNEIK